MIRRYIIWRNKHAADTRLREVVNRANVACSGTQEHAGEHPGRHKRTERDDPLASGSAREDEPDAVQRGEQVSGEGPDHNGPPSVPAQDSPQEEGEFQSPNPKPLLRTKSTK